VLGPRSSPDRELGLLVVVLGLGRPAVLGLLGAVLFVGAKVGSAGVEQIDALLDALERLDHVAFEPDQHADGVLVGPAADLFGVLLGLADDPSTLGLGLLGEPPLVDEERGLLLGAGDDPLRLLLGLLDDPLALGVDALRGPDLLRDGDAELVDEAERGRLIDDDVVRQRELLAVRDDRLKAFDKEDDVDLGTLRLRSTEDGGSLAWIIARAPAADAANFRPERCRFLAPVLPPSPAPVLPPRPAARVKRRLDSPSAVD
jgi:hypothetical protein